ncbi:hypothetical protein [Sporichthya sp.]|uniref:hypothetical protein n=1 Tax=Sporichthya sp. TaxID=65475 RepID=UPI0017A2160A|nr:hypothetical protein [Sporichthya sp.]MBA3743421.1 hypothetical protein [Sporichthya sp.]
MARPRSSQAALLVTLAVLLVTGCGGQPTVTPAGSAGLEVPYDDSAAPGAKPSAGPSAAPSGASPPPVIPLPSSTFAPPKPVKPGKGGSTPKPGVPVPVADGGLVLPALGDYSYAMTGTSSLGKPPAVMKLQVAKAGGEEEQIWTLDARRDDGSGIIEELTLVRRDDGVYLSAYRLDASTGIAAVVLEFAPPAPVLLEPDAAKVGQPWSFDLESTDGCSTAHTEGTLVSEAKPGSGSASLRHVRFTQNLKTIGPPTCPAVTAKRVQDTYHGAGVALPTRIDSDLNGTLGAVPVKANTQATLTSPTPKAMARKPDTD